MKFLNKLNIFLGAMTVISGLAYSQEPAKLCIDSDNRYTDEIVGSWVFDINTMKAIFPQDEFDPMLELILRVNFELDNSDVSLEALRQLNELDVCAEATFRIVSGLSGNVESYVALGMLNDQYFLFQPGGEQIMTQPFVLIAGEDPAKSRLGFVSHNDIIFMRKVQK